MRDTLSKTEFIHSPKRYFEVLSSSDLKIQDIHLVADKCAMVTSATEEDFNEGNGTSNLAIVALTTSHARLRLLKTLRQLDDRVFDYDTDSGIYTSKPGKWESQLGNVLGDWDNQLVSHTSPALYLSEQGHTVTSQIRAV